MCLYFFGSNCPTVSKSAQINQLSLMKLSLLREYRVSVLLAAIFCTTSHAIVDKCTCEGGHFQVTPCSEYQDVTCQACRACEIGEEYRVGSCSPDSNTDFSCKNCSVCGDNQYEAQACDGEHDTVCKPCSHCFEGLTFAIGTCGPESDSDLLCMNCSICSDGKYMSHACNVTHDTLCIDVPTTTVSPFAEMETNAAPVTMADIQTLVTSSTAASNGHMASSAVSRKYHFAQPKCL